MSNPVTCPKCGHPEMQEVGTVSYWCRGEVTRNADGKIEFEPGGYTEYGDDYHESHIECSNCLQLVHTIPNHTPNGYDPAWVEAINHVLEDREVKTYDKDGNVVPLRVSDITDAIWEGWIGPLIDTIEVEGVPS